MLLLDPGQPDVEALELVRQPLVVDPQAVQDRGVQVVDVDRVLDHVVAEVVGLAVLDARPDALRAVPGIGPQLAARIAQARRELDPAVELERCRSAAVRNVAVETPSVAPS